MPLSAEEKQERARQRMIEKAHEMSTGTYSRKFVSGVFQRMIRAEAGADLQHYVSAVVDGELRLVKRQIGQVVCITCGRVTKWNDRNIHTGHFIASRRNSILYEEDNVAPQCAHDNQHQSGCPLEYQQWMEFARGHAAIGRLRRLKTESRSFGHEELVDMRISFASRLKAAEERMK